MATLSLKLGILESAQVAYLQVRCKYYHQHGALLLLAFAQVISVFDQLYNVIHFYVVQTQDSELRQDSYNKLKKEP